MLDDYVLPPDFVPSKADIAGAAVHARRIVDEVGLAQEFCSRASCRRNGRCVGPAGGTMLLPCLQQIRDESPSVLARHRQAEAERAEAAAAFEKVLGRLMADADNKERRAADAAAIEAGDADPIMPALKKPDQAAPQREADIVAPPPRIAARDAPAPARSLGEKAFPWLRAFRPRGLSG